MIIDNIKKLFVKLNKIYNGISIQLLISASFTIIACIGMIAMGSMLFRRFENTTKELIIENNKQLVDQASLNMDTYIRKMMQISDTMYYSVIKNTDLSEDSLDSDMSLLYEANKDSLVSIACFTEKGEIIAATPISNIKTNQDVVNQEWFIKANNKIENVHFSIPHVQNLFQDTDARYYWVTSLSRAVELTEGGNTSRGVLLVDMNFSGIEKIFTKINDKSQGYMYLIDSEGEIIYHPRQKLIYSKLESENNIVAAGYEDGSYEEEFEGNDRIVIVKTIGYTGWRIVSVTPNEEFAVNLNQLRLFVVIVITCMAFLLVFANMFVSHKIADPIKRLEESVKDLENGNLELDIYIGGSHEIKHLGNTIMSVVKQLKKLMDDIVVEQEEKRKTELDALQSQINPHFLYNTLDSVIWMVESERYEEATSMVTSLANLFRISLSKGKNIISIEDEFKHAKNYLNIQKVRYKNKFEVEVDIDPNILDCATIKLIIQPLIENAIYYGVECLMDEGEIYIKGYEKDGDVYIEVTDNGVGIPKETIPLLLTDDTRVRKRGSGIGLKNVHQRIQLYFGEEYGIEIESELDEGTTIRIHIPKIKYCDIEEKDGSIHEKK